MYSILIVSHGHEEDIRRLLSSLDNYMTGVYEVILLDNLGGVNNISDIMSDFQHMDIHLISNIKSRSFSINNNFCASVSRYSRLIFLNPDILLYDFSLPEFLEKWDTVIKDGLYYPKLFNPDLTLQIHGKEKPSFLNQVATFFYSLLNKRRESPKGDYWYFAAAILVNKDFFFRLGGFDEYFPMYAEDVELCDRARKKNYPVEVLSDVGLIHGLGGDSKGKYIFKAVLSNFYLRFKMLKNTVGK